MHRLLGFLTSAPTYKISNILDYPAPALPSFWQQFNFSQLLTEIGRRYKNKRSNNTGMSHCTLAFCISANAAFAKKPERVK